MVAMTTNSPPLPFKQQGITRSRLIQRLNAATSAVNAHWGRIMTVHRRRHHHSHVLRYLLRLPEEEDV